MEDFRVNIGGVPYKVFYKEDAFCSDAVHFGEIRYKESEIYLSKGMNEELEKQTLIHEMMHGIFLGIGRGDLCNDEILVQALAQTMSGCFDVRKEYQFDAYFKEE